MDLPTPLKTLPLGAFALGARAFSPLALALTFALAFATTFAASRLLLNLIPAVILLLPLLLLQLLRRLQLAGSALAVIFWLMNRHRRQRADQCDSQKWSVGARAGGVKAILVLLAQICHQLARACVWW